MKNTKAIKEVKINNEQRLFVILSGTGYTCFGFDNCYRDAVQLLDKLKAANVKVIKSLIPDEKDISTLVQYGQYQGLLKLASEIDLGTWFSPGTAMEVKIILQRAIDNKKALRIFYGNKDTGRCWMDEYDMYGRIGRSTGIMKIPLMMKKNQIGGSGILTNYVIKIVEFTTRKLKSNETRFDGLRSNIIEVNKVLYQHPLFNMPIISLIENEHPEYPASVTFDGVVNARFKSVIQAEKWVSFMKGERSNPGK